MLKMMLVACVSISALSASASPPCDSNTCDLPEVVKELDANVDTSVHLLQTNAAQKSGGLGVGSLEFAEMKKETADLRAENDELKKDYARVMGLLHESANITSEEDAKWIGTINMFDDKCKNFPCANAGHFKVNDPAKDETHCKSTHWAYPPMCVHTCCRYDCNAILWMFMCGGQYAGADRQHCEWKCDGNAVSGMHIQNMWSAMQQGSTCGCHPKAR